jgi:hypothetical protein
MVKVDKAKCFGIWFVKGPDQDRLSKFYIKIQFGTWYKEWYLGTTELGKKVLETDQLMRLHIKSVEGKKEGYNPNCTASYLDYTRNNSPLTVPLGKNYDWILDLEGKVRVSDNANLQKSLQIKYEIT